VANPYARHLTFLDDRTRARRDFPKYLTLIRTLALLHQHQRPVKTVEHRGERVEYVEATLDDIALANKLAAAALGRSLDELPPQTRRLLRQLQVAVARECAEKAMRVSDFRFTRRDVRAWCGLSDVQARVHLGRLVELEYLLVHRGQRGQSFVYELLVTGGDDSGPLLPGLVDVEALRHQYDSNLAGAERRFAGSTRPQRGASAGTSRGAENDKDGQLEAGSSHFSPSAAPRALQSRAAQATHYEQPAVG